VSLTLGTSSVLRWCTFLFFSTVDLGSEDSGQGSGARIDAVTRGFEALVKPRQKRPTSAKELGGRWHCRRPLDAGDTITLTKPDSLSVQHLNEH
jgi:hypothetical protein